MSEALGEIEGSPKRPSLKVVEPRVNVVTPWTDDKLERQKIANRLTTVIEDQHAPFVISLDGRWGTGKTFLLKRWQQALVNDRNQAIYFNAWEDDFCDDPLLAIIGQLTEHFREGTLGRMASSLGNIALPILTAKLTGVAFKAKDLKPEGMLSDYRKQQETKRKVRERLAHLAAEVRKETGWPLVFVIDELDRCRPTFAIELLERVKHIFDVPNIVFVFGINRGELVKSLESVYGEIDTSVYLRRFFDMEFILPNEDPAAFCANLVQEHQLDAHFADLIRSYRDSTNAREYETLKGFLPSLYGQMGLSLRDIDYCVRLLALATKELQEGQSFYPYLAAALIAVRVCNQELYRRFVYGDARGAELIEFMFDRRALYGTQVPDQDSSGVPIFDAAEAAIYCADDYEIVVEQLRLLQGDSDPARPQYVSKEVVAHGSGQAEGAKRLESLLSLMERYMRFYPPPNDKLRLALLKWPH